MSDPSVNILALLRIRDDDHLTQTDEIFEKIIPVLQGIADFVKISLKRIIWTNIKHHGNNILFIATVKPIEADKKSNPDLENISIQVALPPKLIDFGTTEQVVDFLNEIERAKASGTEHSYKTLTDNLSYNMTVLSEIENEISDNSDEDGRLIH